MLNATREKKGLGVRRERHPIPAYGPFQIIRSLNSRGDPVMSLAPIVKKVKKQKTWPINKY